MHVLPTSDILPDVCKCLTAGVFLYMAFVELLPSEFGHNHSHEVRYEEEPLQLWEYREIDQGDRESDDIVRQKMLVFVASAAAMSFLAFFV